MKQSLEAGISSFGAEAKIKLANPAGKWQPENQIRAPFEQLLADLIALCKVPPQPWPPSANRRSVI
jgi:hypothetical protein